MVSVNSQDAFLASVRYAAQRHREERGRMIDAITTAKLGGVPIRAIVEASGYGRTTVYGWLAESREEVADRTPED